MRSLSLLVLLFAVVAYTTAAPSAQSPPAASTLVKELVANGTKQRLKSFNGLYLTDDHPDQYLYALDQRLWSPPQEWTIVPMSNDEVAIKSFRGNYIAHANFGRAKQSKAAAEWELLTPVKNADGSWSFKSRWNKWLSAHTKGTLKEGEKHRYDVTFESDNKKSEHWSLERV